MMGDKLKLSKGKRHRSSSSLAGVVLEGTFSERKLDIKASIPEVDDHFAVAEARCEELQEKIDLVKTLKKKRKLKKRSTTRVTDQQMLIENVPFISVRAQPKRKVAQQAVRLRPVETSVRPTRGYVDPTILEQHLMINKNADMNLEQRDRPRSHAFSGRAHGDGVRGQGVQITTQNVMDATSCVGVTKDYINNGYSEQQQAPKTRNKIVSEGQRSRLQEMVGQQRTILKTSSNEEVEGRDNLPVRRQQQMINVNNKLHKRVKSKEQNLERPLVELFNKNIGKSSVGSRKGNASAQVASGYREKAKALDTPRCEETNEPLRDSKQMGVQRSAHRIRYRTARRYEMPTVASQMKQTGVRYYAATTNATNIPFVISKSTAPSHNIGVNIQQVLYGLKNQQPLSGIPMTIAHHMGLGHISHETKSVQEVPDYQTMNAIRLGRRLLMLPMYKSMSYSRLLHLFREGDGMVPRFLRGLSRPHYFYTSMYNLATNREDIDGATSKGQPGRQAARQRLAEYASMYREYEQLEKNFLTEDYKPEHVKRHGDLQRELELKKNQIQKVNYKVQGESETHYKLSSYNGVKLKSSAADTRMEVTVMSIGLGHISHETNSVQEVADYQTMNAIRLGRRLLMLPMYKSMSYSRLLHLFRKGDGMVPRFLRGLSRPHYFYTSMYNLATNLEDIDGATSKGQPGRQAARQRLAEYASMYREYEQLEKNFLTEDYKPEHVKRHGDLQRELELKKNQIQKLLQDFGSGGGTKPSTLHASSSAAEAGYRRSTCKLNAGDTLHC